MTRASLLLLGATLAIKAVVLAQLDSHPLLQPVGTLDSAVYVDLGRRLAGGDIALGVEPYFLAPLYAYFLGAVFFLSGGSLLAAKTAQIVLGTAAIGLVLATARHWFGPRAAGISAVLCAATGVLTFHEVVLLQAALDPFLTALALWLLTRAFARGTLRGFGAAGLAFGLFALNRPNALAAAAVVAVMLLGKRALAFAAGVVLAIAPVTLRNWAVSGEPVLISSHGGLNFYIGNNPEADGTYHSVPGVTPDLTGQAGDRSAGFYAKAWDWIRREPGDALRLFLRKCLYVFNQASPTLNFSYAYFARDEPTLLRLLLVGPWLLVPLGLVGLATGRATGYAAWVAFVPAYALSVAAFFVADRYRLPLLIPLAIGAGAGALDLKSRWPIALVLAAVANWPLGLDEGVSRERTRLVLHRIGEGRADAALLERAAKGHPQPGLLYYQAGRAFQARGQTADAIALFERALAADPGQAEVRLNLGQALVDTSRPAEAEPHLRAAFLAGTRKDLAAFDLSRALGATGRREEALAVLRTLALPGSQDAASLLAIGRLALDLGDAALAERALAGAPPSAEAREALGVARGLVGRNAEAVAALQEASRLDPASASIRLNLAVALAQAGRRVEARREAQEALRLRPDYPQARALLERLR